MEKIIADDGVMPVRPRNPRKPQARTATLYIGQWIRALGQKPADVARAIDMNEGYLSQLISGKKTNPSSTVLLQLADQLGIPVHYFYRLPPDREFLKEAAGLDAAVLRRLTRQ